jgi:hypothetical protein
MKLPRVAAFGYIEPFVRSIAGERMAAVGETPILLLGVPAAMDQSIDIQLWLEDIQAAALFTGFSFERVARKESLAALTAAFERCRISFCLLDEEAIFPKGTGELTLQQTMNTVASALLERADLLLQQQK